MCRESTLEIFRKKTIRCISNQICRENILKIFGRKTIRCISNQMCPESLVEKPSRGHLLVNSENQNLTFNHECYLSHPVMIYGETRMNGSINVNGLMLLTFYLNPRKLKRKGYWSFSFFQKFVLELF